MGEQQQEHLFVWIDCKFIGWLVSGECTDGRRFRLNNTRTFLPYIVRPSVWIIQLGHLAVHSTYDEKRRKLALANIIIFVFHPCQKKYHFDRGLGGKDH